MLRSCCSVNVGQGEGRKAELSVVANHFEGVRWCAPISGLALAKRFRGYRGAPMMCRGRVTRQRGRVGLGEVGY